jgi:aryl-alcohol dehydrogenase-like predicted oxidoreductase
MVSLVRLTAHDRSRRYSPRVASALVMTRQLGHTDLEIGAIAFGCWRFGGTDVATARARIETALDSGMNLIDTADVYGLDNDCPWGAAEELLGRVFAEAPELRERMVLATKGGIHLGSAHQGVDGLGVPYESSGEWLIRACEASLRRLNTDVIDLYQIHRPDLLAHPGDVAETLVELVESGKVKYVGVSNYSASQLTALLAFLDVPLVSIQPEFSIAQLASIDDGVLDVAMTHQLTPLAWSPLAGGRLIDAAARQGNAEDERFARIHTVMDELAATHGTDRNGIALAFVLAHPAGIIPIIGTGNLDRIRSSAEAVNVKLNKAECYRLIAASGRVLP